jgi:peroxiredoxin
MMPRLRPGQPAPDLTLSRLDGSPVALSSFWGSRHHLLLIFLRHLG